MKLAFAKFPTAKSCHSTGSSGFLQGLRTSVALSASVSFTFIYEIRGGFRAAAKSKMECFVIIVNGFQPLTTITKHSILDDAAALDPHLEIH